MLQTQLFTRRKPVCFGLLIYGVLSLETDSTVIIAPNVTHSVAFSVHFNNPYFQNSHVDKYVQFSNYLY